TYGHAHRRGGLCPSTAAVPTEFPFHESPPLPRGVPCSGALAGRLIVLRGSNGKHCPLCGGLMGHATPGRTGSAKATPSTGPAASAGGDDHPRGFAGGVRAGAGRGGGGRGRRAVPAGRRGAPTALPPAGSGGLGSACSC